jgi:hypothetical protein
MADELSTRYAELLDGTYDCVDRIVLNAYHSLCYSAGGFRQWWRSLMGGSEEQLDNAHLMRMAGRFSRRVRAFAKAHDIPVVDCRRRERKHELAEEYLATHAVGRGLFLILVGRAAAPVWEVKHSSGGGVQLTKKLPYVNHSSFHIMDPEWGHITIKMAGHPPFGAQIILNGHEYVACRARRAGLDFVKEGNCFTQIADAPPLARLAETLSEARTVGRLVQVCQRWIYSACLCFALGSDEQERTGFRYAYSVYQVEYSRNLLFHRGSQLEQVFQRLVDRTRARLDVAQVRTLFGAKRRPHWHWKGRSAPRVMAVVETLAYDLTVFKVHFGNLTLKAYTKGERVLRIEAVAHNTQELGCGRVVARFPSIVARLKGMLERFLTTLDCVDVAFISDQMLDQLPLPSRLGKTRLGGIDLNNWRTRTVLTAVLALGPSPTGFNVAQLRSKVQALTGQAEADYTQRQAAYDLKKLRGKDLITKLGRSRRYQLSPPGMRAITALLVLREQVIRPILAGVQAPAPAPKPTHSTPADHHYERLRLDFQPLLHELGIAA